MPKRNLTRRRMIAIMATAAGSALVAGGRIARADDAVRWRGSALGAQVSLEIYHPDRAEAERLVQACLSEVRRLEQQFSLYQPDSAICTLNRTGILVAPAPDMVSLLKTSLYFSELTGGAFDPTVQPLWALYAKHFSSDRPDPDGPPADLLADALARVGSKGLLVSDTRVALVRHGAAVTLNGIAQRPTASSTCCARQACPRHSSIWVRSAPSARDPTALLGMWVSPIRTGPARSRERSI
jgi:thiamine biosynthesis lipoprotein